MQPGEIEKKRRKAEQIGNRRCGCRGGKKGKANGKCELKKPNKGEKRKLIRELRMQFKPSVY